MGDLSKLVNEIDRLQHAEAELAEWKAAFPVHADGNQARLWTKSLKDRIQYLEQCLTAKGNKVYTLERQLETANSECAALKKNLEAAQESLNKITGPSEHRMYSIWRQYLVPLEMLDHLNKQEIALGAWRKAFPFAKEPEDIVELIEGLQAQLKLAEQKQQEWAAGFNEKCHKIIELEKQLQPHLVTVQGGTVQEDSATPGPATAVFGEVDDGSWQCRALKAEAALKKARHDAQGIATEIRGALYRLP